MNRRYLKLCCMSLIILFLGTPYLSLITPSPGDLPRSTEVQADPAPLAAEAWAAGGNKIVEDADAWEVVGDYFDEIGSTRERFGIQWVRRDLDLLLKQFPIFLFHSAEVDAVLKRITVRVYSLPFDDFSTA